MLASWLPSPDKLTSLLQITSVNGPILMMVDAFPRDQICQIWFLKDSLATLAGESAVRLGKGGTIEIAKFHVEEKYSQYLAKFSAKICCE